MTAAHVAQRLFHVNLYFKCLNKVNAEMHAKNSHRVFTYVVIAANANDACSIAIGQTPIGSPLRLGGDELPSIWKLDFAHCQNDEGSDLAEIVHVGDSDINEAQASYTKYQRGLMVHAA